MKKLITLAVAMLVAVSANAANWQTLGKGPQGSISIERSTVKHLGNHVLVWVRIDATQLYTDDETGITWDRAISRVDIDCALDTINYVEASYSLHSKQVLSTAGHPGHYLVNIEPDSFEHTIEQAVCTP